MSGLAETSYMTSGVLPYALFSKAGVFFVCLSVHVCLYVKLCLLVCQPMAPRIEYGRFRAPSKLCSVLTCLAPFLDMYNQGTKKGHVGVQSSLEC